MTSSREWGPDRVIVTRAFELALLMARHEGTGWPALSGELRRFHLHTAAVELHYRIRLPDGHRSGVTEHTYLTYEGPWGRWEVDIDGAGNLVHIAYQARGAAADP